MEEVNHKADERIDLVIFLNGLTIFAVELKCNTSGQSYEDAIKQYKERRDASTRLFKSRVGVLAAFAMDLNEVYFFKETPSFDNNTQNTELFNRAKDFEKKLKRAQTSAQTPAQWMKQRMAEEHWHEYTFENKTGLDKMHYSRVQNETHHFTMLPLIAMGVGLSLDISEMTAVLNLGGMTFIPGDRAHEAYKYLFTAMYGKGIDECNAFLENVGVATLGTKQRY